MASTGAGEALTTYRAKLTTYQPLSEETERALAAAWKAGDRKAGDSLICACLPFVVSIAMEYRRWGIPLEDVIQQGNIGLLRAADRFDPSRDCRLITYAAYWIRAEIRDFVVRSYRMVRFGTTKGERRALRLYRTTREDDPAALARGSGLSEERVRQLLPLLMSSDSSLDAESPSTGLTGLERLVAQGPSPEDEVAAAERDRRARTALDIALKELSPREQMIVLERWTEDDPVTLEKLGTRLGVSKERVRQIEERARAKLRARLEQLGHAAALRRKGLSGGGGVLRSASCVEPCTQASGSVCLPSRSGPCAAPPGPLAPRPWGTTRWRLRRSARRRARRARSRASGRPRRRGRCRRRRACRRSCGATRRGGWWRRRGRTWPQSRRRSILSRSPRR